MLVMPGFSLHHFRRPLATGRWVFPAVGFFTLLLVVIMMWLTVAEATLPDSESHHAAGSREAGTAPFGQTVIKDSCTAFVSNLDYAVTADQLHEIFSKVCKLITTRVEVNISLAFLHWVEMALHPWPFVSDIAIFVLKGDVKLELTN